jgi:hypothetical protein
LDINHFLAGFAATPDHELHKLRRTPKLDEWPTDEAFYFNLTRTMFSEPRQNDPPWAQPMRRQRFVGILCEFLYHDGRTFSVLLHIAELASREPAELGMHGVNALAAIWCYLNMGRPIPMPEEQVLSLLKGYESVAVLSHNAARCLNALQLRRPDLS